MVRTKLFFMFSKRNLLSININTLLFTLIHLKSSLFYITTYYVDRLIQIFYFIEQLTKVDCFQKKPHKVKGRKCVNYTAEYCLR